MTPINNNQMSERIIELFVVDKKLGIRKAMKIAKEQARIKGLERGTPWFMAMRIENPKNLDPKFYGDLWPSILSHFSTGRNELYYLFDVITQ